MTEHDQSLETNRRRRKYASFAERPRWQKYGFFILAFILLLSVMGCVAIYTNLHKTKINLDNVILEEEEMENIRQKDQENLQKFGEQEQEPEDFYALIIGLDYRGDHNGINTDTLIVAHVIPQNRIVKLVSVPRDLRIRSLRGEEVKINSIFASGYNQAVRAARERPELLSGQRVQLGDSKVHEEYVSSGMVLTRETLERYMDIDIKYTFLATFQTLTSLVDAVGGIEIEVDRSMEYNALEENMSIRLEPGLQMMDGDTALQYARFRLDNRGEAYHSNDFERGMRQQQVIRGLVDKLTSWNNLPKALEIMDIVSSNLKTDMSPNTMISMLTEYYGQINQDDIFSLPFPGYWNNPYVDVREEHLDLLLEQFTSLDLPDIERLTDISPYY